MLLNKASLLVDNDPKGMRSIKKDLFLCGTLVSLNMERGYHHYVAMPLLHNGANLID